MGNIKSTTSIDARKKRRQQNEEKREKMLERVRKRL